MESIKNKFNFSVLMSVYFKDNAAYLDLAIKSIYLDQVLKPDQIVIVKDGSLNSQLEQVIEKWTSELSDIITIVNIEKNRGLANALNLGLQYCNHEYVARMDADDISVSERFQAQMEYMNSNPELSVISSWIEEYSEDMCRSLGIRKVPEDNELIHRFSKYRNPLNHPAVVFKKSDVLNIGGYPLFDRAQDYALWSLMLNKGFKFGNISQVLLKMRTGKALLSRRGMFHFKQEAKILKFQKKIGFISYRRYLLNLLMRFLFRVQPNFIKSILYKKIK